MNYSLLKFALGSLLIAAIGLHGANAHAQGILPRMIRAKQLEKYLKYIELSPEQQAEVKRLHEAYSSNWNDSFGAEIQEFNKKWGATYVSPSRFQGESMAKSFEEANEIAERLKYKLRLANDSFFDSVEALLADEQLLGMQRVRLAHDRYSYHRAKLGIRERSIDLIEMVESMDLPEIDRAAAEAYFIEFEPVFVQALRDAAEADQRVAAQQFSVLDLMTPLNGANADEVTQTEMDRLLRAAGSIATNPNKRLVHAIRAGLAHLKEILRPSSYSLVEQRYNETAYPEVYPDGAFAEPYYEQALHLDALKDEQTSALKTMYDDYLGKHSRVCKQMAQLLYDSSVIYFRSEEGYQDKADQKYLELLALGAQREQLNLAQANLIRGFLTPEQVEQLGKWKYEEESPPRPWDPHAPHQKKHRPPATTLPSPGSAETDDND